MIGMMAATALPRFVDALPTRLPTLIASPLTVMMAVPEAWRLPRMPGSAPSAMSASVSAGGKQGTLWAKYPQANGTGVPAISQWPEGVSLPAERSIPMPKDAVPPASDRPGGSRPVAIRQALPSPMAQRWGRCSGPDRRPARSPSPPAHASAMWPSVSAPASP